MSHADLATVLQIASTQRGVVTTPQLQRAGCSETQLRRLVTSGLLVRVIDGAYRTAVTVDDELSRCVAVSLARPGLTISGPTAGRLHGFRRVPNDRLVHVISKPQAQPTRTPWIQSYRTALLHDQDVTMRNDGIRLTSPARTVVDMVRYASGSAVVSMIEQGLDRTWFTEQHLRRTAEHTSTTGRPFARQLLDLLDDRLAGGPAGWDWEVVVGDHLRAIGVTGIVRQHPLTVPGYGQLRFDLAVPERRWALEIDVHPSHYTREGAARDKFRDRCCAEMQWLVQRIGEPDLRFDWDATFASIQRTLNSRPIAASLHRAS